MTALPDRIRGLTQKDTPGIVRDETSYSQGEPAPQA